ncbi:MAG: LPS export ABC transporter periplasmic protein LptC [bacterium]
MSKKFIILALAMSTILLVGLWAYGVSKDITKDLKQTREITAKNDENVDMSGLLLTETKDGQKFWEIYAIKGKYIKNKTIAKLKTVKGNIYKDNKLVLSFKAPDALYNDSNKNLKLMNGALAVSDSGLIISSNQIEWSNKADLFYATGDVRIKQGKKFYSTGNYSVFNREFTSFKMKGHAKTRVYQ